MSALKTMGRSYRFRGGEGGGGGGGGILKNLFAKAKKSPTKFFAGMKKVVCRKMTPEKKCFHRQQYRKKNCLPWKNFHPPASKKIMVSPIDRQDTAAYSVF